MQVFGKHAAVAAEERREPLRKRPELQLLEDVEHHRQRRLLLEWGLRALGALALIAVGSIHLHEYLGLYSAIPTIGTLFLLNFVGAVAIGGALLAPTERLLGRLGGLAVALLALAGIAHAASSFVFLLISERTPLFGFMEPGYDPPGMASRVAEVVTVALLGSFLSLRLSRRVRSGRW
jgi:hypothetical protein